MAYDSMYKCNCGRPYCEYFDPSEKEWGCSHSKEDLVQMLVDIPEEIKELKKKLKHIKKLLA